MDSKNGPLYSHLAQQQTDLSFLGFFPCLDAPCYCSSLQVWEHSVDLLRRGFLSGSIITVDPEDALALGKPWTRR